MSSLPQSQPELERQNAVHISSLSDYEGLKNAIWENPSRVKVIKVGASWCAPCTKVAPAYVNLASETRAILKLR